MKYSLFYHKVLVPSRCVEMVVHTWQYNTMHPKLELYYFNAVSSLYLEPLVNSIAHSGAGRLYADHRASTLVLPRRLPSSWSAKSRKSRLPTIGGALQAQSAKFTTPRLPLRRGTSTHAAFFRKRGAIREARRFACGQCPRIGHPTRCSALHL